MRSRGAMLSVTLALLSGFAPWGGPRAADGADLSGVMTPAPVERLAERPAPVVGCLGETLLPPGSDASVRETEAPRVPVRCFVPAEEAKEARGGLPVVGEPAPEAIAPPSGLALRVGVLPSGPASGASAIEQGTEGIVLDALACREASAELRDEAPGNRGLAGIDHEAGRANSQASVLVVAAGLAGVALSDAALAQVSAGNAIVETPAPGAGPGSWARRSTIIDSSMNDNRGLLSVNQAAGALNQQAAAFAITVLAPAGSVSASLVR